MSSQDNLPVPTPKIEETGEHGRRARGSQGKPLSAANKIRIQKYVIGMLSVFGTLSIAVIGIIAAWIFTGMQSGANEAARNAIAKAVDEEKTRLDKYLSNILDQTNKLAENVRGASDKAIESGTLARSATARISEISKEAERAFESIGASRKRAEDASSEAERLSRIAIDRARTLDSRMDSLQKLISPKSADLAEKTIQFGDELAQLRKDIADAAKSSDLTIKTQQIGDELARLRKDVTNGAKSSDLADKTQRIDAELAQLRRDVSNSVKVCELRTYILQVVPPAGVAAAKQAAAPHEIIIPGDFKIVDTVLPYTFGEKVVAAVVIPYVPVQLNGSLRAVHAEGQGNKVVVHAQSENGGPGTIFVQIFVFYTGEGGPPNGSVIKGVP